MWWCIILILIFVMAMIFVLNKWLTADFANSNRRVNIVFERHNILDCDAINIPCVSDRQCRDNCRGGLVMHCNLGGFCSRGARWSVEDCDASKGLIVALNAVDGLMVDRLCLSLYRDVIQDDGEIRPYVCEGGNLELDLENQPFHVDNCICGPNHTKFSYNSGAFTRTIPVCIPNESASLYDRIYS
ncbi:unknown [Cryptophlebia leucotreta granulovirus]|uniref:Pif-3 n=1 Tax=Cryptophlebia leucotreta granulosis virus TaxID=35254 RepID=Q7T5Q5_GVCL|nr:hypothetical protein [Cryptophlebia leucotreta granulovirus]AAQ21629.1 unknown [Cryptophlebia leucotreta granulovirus]